MYKIEDPDLGLISISVIVLGGQGFSEEKACKAHAALSRNTFEYLLSCTVDDDTRNSDQSLGGTTPGNHSG